MQKPETKTKPNQTKRNEAEWLTKGKNETQPHPPAGLQFKALQSDISGIGQVQ